MWDSTLLLLTWVKFILTIFSLIAIRKAKRVIINRKLSQKWKTRPVKSIAISIKDRIIEVSQLRTSGLFFDNYRRRFEEEETHTLRTSFLGKGIVVTKSPKNVKWILGKNVEDWDLGSRPSAFGPLLGKGIFVADGERWRHLRAMLKPQFMREQVSHVSMIEPHMEVLKNLIRLKNGQPFDIQPLFHKLTMDTATEFLFGESVSSLQFELPNKDVDSEDLKSKILFDQSLLFVQEYQFFRILFFDYGWIWNSARFRRSVANIHEFTKKAIDKILKLRKQKGPNEQSELLYIFLDALMKETTDPQVLRDESLNIMLAGRSTTASLLLSIFYELARNPDVWQRLRTEVLSCFGNGELPEELASLTFENLKRCVYLRYVINETLRLYPPVMLNLRRAIRDTCLPEGGGAKGEDPCLINEGEYVALHIYSMHRLESVFGDDAAIYNPDRWATISSKVGSAFIPFGTGPRVCLGQQYALTEASYATVRLLQTFDNIESHNSAAYPPSKRITATLQFSEGVMISLY